MADKSAVEAQPKTTWCDALRARWHVLLEEHESQVFLTLSIVIGAVTGLTVVAFILLTERLGMRLYPADGAAWRRLLIPVAGALTMGFLLYRYFPSARGSGVPQTKAALYAHDGRITLRTVLGKFFCTATTLASGIPLGREGPSVQVGAGIASVLGRHLGLRPEKVKALIPVGAAAAIAAAFNTPMAAVIFAMEEVVGDLNAPVLGSAVLASAVSWAMLRLCLGNAPLFHVPPYELVNPLEFGIYAILGVAGGVLSAVFARLLLVMRARFQRLPRRSRWWHPVVGGILVGAMGLFVPQLLGVGYGYVGEALNGSMALKLMMILVVLKLFAVTTSYASGNAGGIFGPSLFLGAMLGGVVGSVAHNLLPAYTAAPGAYALVGMGALFAGIVRAPMTSVLMIFEMTRDYSIIVPLMIANLVSLFIASRLQKQPLYEALAYQDGIHLPNPRSRHEGAGRTVALLLRDAPGTLPMTMSVQQAIERTQSSLYNAWPVMENGQFMGLLSRKVLDEALADGRGSQHLKNLLDEHFFLHAHTDHPLHYVLEMMSSSQLDLLPVIDRADIHKLEGVVTLHDVLDAYGFDISGLA